MRELKAGLRPDIRTWRVENNRFIVEISGLHAEGREGKPPVISRYYFTLDRYDPFVGKPWLQGRLARPFRELDDVVRMAKESQATWDDGLKQSRLMKALRINRLLTKDEQVQVEVHLTFLGAFTHATQRAYDLCFGRDRLGRTRRFDHYSHELVALYVVTLACAELLTLRRALRRRPAVEIIGWSEQAESISATQRLASYLWFLSGAPTEYDRVAEVHTRVGDRLRMRSRRAIDPAEVRTVRFYRNPMERLIGLHSSFEELTTRVAYRSAWERPDARSRAW